MRTSKFTLVSGLCAVIVVVTLLLSAGLSPSAVPLPSAVPSPSAVPVPPVAQRPVLHARLASVSGEVRARFTQGAVMLHARRYELAAIALQRVIDLAPRIPEAHANLGFALAGLGRWHAARTAFETALEIDPRQANAYYGLGMVADALGDRPAALGAMRSYVHLAAVGDPFVARARAALWEWQAAPSASDFDLPAGDGGRLRSRDWRGRVAIVNVWALWCAPCRSELPALQRFARALDPRRFVVAAIAAQSDPLATREYLGERRLDLANGIDPDAAVTRARLGVQTYPETLVLDAGGRIVLRLRGVQDWDAPALRARLERIAAAGAAVGHPVPTTIARR